MKTTSARPSLLSGLCLMVAAFSMSSMFIPAAVSAATLPLTWTANDSANLLNQTSARYGKLFGEFETTTLAPGDSLTFSGSFSFAGANVTNNQGFRVGLFNNSGDPSIANDGKTWKGYLVAANSSTNTADSGGVWRKIGNDLWFGRNGAVTNETVWQLSPKATNPSASGAAPMVASTYNFSIKIERTGENAVSLTVSIVDAADPCNYSFVFTHTDQAATTFAYNQVAFYTDLGRTETITFSNMTLTTSSPIPEPSSIALLGGLTVLLAAVLVLRHKK